MTSAARSATTRSAERPARKSPLRVAGMQASASIPSLMPAPGGNGEAHRGREITAQELRQMAISEFTQWLRSRTNKHKRSFQEDTIAGYAETASTLSRWMTGQGIDEDFTACDDAMLNRFFADYRKTHTQGGTNTRQRNLHHLFTWLQKAYDHPDPWTPELQRYGPGKQRPSTLAEEFIRDLLEVTGGGKARDFDDVRDHAIVRSLTEGVRRTELAQQETADLSSDLIARPFVRVVPLKGAREYSEGRLVPLAMSTSRALAAYLRVRKSHRHAKSPALWLGRRGPLTGSGVARMLQRRAEQAGYDPDVRPHQFRHTFANDWLYGGGSEGDLMRLMGWTDRAMVDRYAEDMQVQRAVDAKRRRGDMY
jgi:integrase/recombinase XerD